MEHAAARVPLGEHRGDVAPRHPGQRRPGLPAGLQRAEGVAGEEHRAAAAGGRGGQQPAVARGVVEGRPAQCERAAVAHGRKGVENRHGALDGSPSRRGSGRTTRFLDRDGSGSLCRLVSPTRSSIAALRGASGRTGSMSSVVGESSSQVKAKCSAATRRQSSSFHGGAATASSSVDAMHPDEYRAEPVLPAAQHCRHLRDLVPGVAHAAPPGRRRDISRPSDRASPEKQVPWLSDLPHSRPDDGRRLQIRGCRRTVARGRERSPRTVRASRSRSDRFRATWQRAPRRHRAPRARPGPEAGAGRSRAPRSASSERSTGQRPVRGASASSRPYNAWSLKVAQLI